MRSARWIAAPAAAAVALTAAGGAGALAPTGTRVSPLPVQDVALSGRSIAYVADVPRVLHCSRIGYWNPRTRRAFTVGSRELCRDEASTGQGVWDVAVAKNRLLWVTYAGGNFREWTLWTATVTRRTPRQLRFVSRPVEDPPPIVLGPGTDEGLPYAVGAEIVYLGDRGDPLFRTTAPAPVRALATHPSGSRFGVAVAALLANDEIVGLARDGTEVLRLDVPPRATAIAFDDRRGIVYQVANVVRADGDDVALPVGSTMVDAARGRILWTRAGDLGMTEIATGRSVRLVDGSRTRPVHGQLEPAGIAWAHGRRVHWHAGLLP